MPRDHPKPPHFLHFASPFIVIFKVRSLELEGKYSLESTDPRENEIRAHLRP